MPRKPFNPRLSRRSLLAGLGAATVLTPFLPALQSHAEDLAPPKRLLLVFSANGTIHDAWKPSGSETDFSFGEILAPLTDHRGDLVILDGLRVKNEGPGDDHQKGMGQLWSGSKLLNGGDFMGGNGESVGWGGGKSIDQEVAGFLKGQQASAHFDSLQMGVRTGGADIWSRMIYSGPNAPIHPEDNPYKVFDNLFSEFGLSAAELARLRAERKSVIDVVKADLADLNTRYGVEDRVKVEAHLHGIREIEKRLSAEGAVGEACEVPQIEPDIAVEDGNYPALLKLQTDLMVMALACDLTRVASLQWSRAVSNLHMSWLDGVGKGHHDYSHDGDGDAGATGALIKINNWYAQQFAYLLQRLKSIPEGEGTMLDNTLVVWGNELAKGNAHSHHPTPFVLAGRCGGRVQTGRWLQYDQNNHCQLLVAIGQAMGMDLQSFGDMDEGQGALPNLL